MKQIILTDQLAELTEVTIKKGGEDVTEKWTKFCQTSNLIINSGIPYQDTDHYRRVRKAMKALLEFKKDKNIYLEDSQYRELWGTNEAKGFLQRFTGWASTDFTDQYIDCWDTAKTVSVQQMKKETKAA